MAETLAAPAETAKPETRQDTKPEEAGKPEGKSKDEKPIKRQMIGFTFFKVLPEWRRLPAAERAEHKRLFAAVLARWNQPGRLLSLTYSTVGLRPDCDMVLWRICYSVDDLSEMMAELLATPLGGYLEVANNYISMTKRSQYLIGHEHEGQHDSRGSIRPGGQKYIFIYPF